MSTNSAQEANRILGLVGVSDELRDLLRRIADAFRRLDATYCFVQLSLAERNLYPFLFDVLMKVR